jgi:protoporphyrinogen oxidase
MTDAAGGSGLEPRVEADVAEIKSILNRLAPRIDEMYGFMTAKFPELATKAELAELRTETKTEIAAVRTELKSEIAEMRIEIMQRPARRQTVFDGFAIVSLIGVILTIAARFAH